MPPQLVFGQSLGELFVVRSAGSVADRMALASMEYAAEHLHARVLRVLGHEQCGAVGAAASGERMPSENLRALVDEIAPGLEPLRGEAQGPELVRRGVEANVLATAREVVERSPLLQQRVQEGKLTVLRAVYELGSGRVCSLDSQPLAAVHH